MTENSGGSFLLSLGFWLALLSVIALAISGPGSRLGLWNFRFGFTLMRYSAMLGLVAALICIVILFVSLRSGFSSLAVLAIAGIVIGLFTFGNLALIAINSKHIPRINDITTDIKNPPQFAALLQFRKNAPVPSMYPGPDTAANQLQAYPGIKPFVSGLSTGDAFDRALKTGVKMGWKILDSNMADGHIEATDTTFWYGFKDDIVIRIMPTKTGSIVDMRSTSRVGKSDFGTNAKRILKFMKLMAESH